MFIDGTDLIIDLNGIRSADEFAGFVPDGISPLTSETQFRVMNSRNLMEKTPFSQS